MAYEGQKGVRDVFAALDDGAAAILVYGGAGVGKSHLVRYLKGQAGSGATVIVAPTAIAALTSGGQTIHSFFKFPPRVLDARNLDPFHGAPPQLWRHIKRLIVDEVSMVRPDLIDAMDARLRRMRGDPRPFGGVQVILVGDPLQLPPIAKDDELRLLYAMGYKTLFLHSGHVWREVDGLRAVELTETFRQTEPDFIAALNVLRRGRGRDIDRATAFLNAQCFRPHRPGAVPVLLTPTRAAADRYNAEGLGAIDKSEIVYRGAATYHFEIQKQPLPVPEILRLKVDAEVMAVTNESQHRWVNGSRGRVVELQEDAARVLFYGTGETHLVTRQTWTKIKQAWDNSRQRIVDNREGDYTQLPLLPGWALTIHKSQGMTLDDVRVDLGHGTFASGQLYVAVSRARSLAGLSLARPLTPGDVKPDIHLLAFMDWLDTQREDRSGGPPS